MDLSFPIAPLSHTLTCLCVSKDTYTHAHTPLISCCYHNHELQPVAGTSLALFFILFAVSCSFTRNLFHPAHSSLFSFLSLFLTSSLQISHNIDVLFLVFILSLSLSIPSYPGLIFTHLCLCTAKNMPIILSASEHFHIRHDCFAAT